MVWLGRNLKDYLVPRSCDGQGHLLLDHAARSPVQPGFEYMQLCLKEELNNCQYNKRFTSTEEWMWMSKKSESLCETTLLISILVLSTVWYYYKCTCITVFLNIFQVRICQDTTDEFLQDYYVWRAIHFHSFFNSLVLSLKQKVREWEYSS